MQKPNHVRLAIQRSKQKAIFNRLKQTTRHSLLLAQGQKYSSGQWKTEGQGSTLVLVIA